MNNIRLFIVSTSLFLIAWLSAAYTTQLDKNQSLNDTVITSDTAVHHQSADNKKERVSPTASLAGFE